jgi:hypothetical protein
MNMLLIKENAQSTSLGVANGLVQFSMCLARTFAPVFVRWVVLHAVAFQSLTLHAQLKLRVFYREESVGRSSLGCGDGIHQLGRNPDHEKIAKTELVKCAETLYSSSPLRIN